MPKINFSSRTHRFNCNSINYFCLWISHRSSSLWKSLCFLCFQHRTLALLRRSWADPLSNSNRNLLVQQEVFLKAALQTLWLKWNPLVWITCAVTKCRFILSWNTDINLICARIQLVLAVCGFKPLFWMLMLIARIICKSPNSSANQRRKQFYLAFWHCQYYFPDLEFIVFIWWNVKRYQKTFSGAHFR